MAYLKSIFRSIRNSFSRYISIVLIIALGVSFFVGIKAATPDMLETVNDYFKQYNLMDIRIQSSIGLTADDINYIQNMDPGIEAVSGMKFKDALVRVNGEIEKDIDGTQISTRVYGLNTTYLFNYINYGLDEAVFMNRPKLLQGEYPDSPDECLVDASQLSTPESYKIGSVITLEGDGEDLSDSMSVTRFTIVGIIESPYYISFERGNTNIGSGKIGTFIYVPESVFTVDYYSEIYIKISGSDAYDAYSEEYFDYINPYISMVKAIAQPRLEERVTYLQNTLPQQISDAQLELTNATSAAGSQTAELENTIATLEQTISLLSAQLTEAQQTYSVTLVDAEDALNISKEEYNTNLTEYNTKLTEYQTNSAAYAAKKTEYDTKYAEYTVNKQEYDSKSSQVQTAQLQVQTTQAAISSAESVLSQLQSRQQQSLSTAEAQAVVALLQTAYPGIYDIVATNSSSGLASEIMTYIQPMLQDYQAQLITQNAQLAAATAELATAETSLQEANTQLTQAKTELDNAQASLSSAQTSLLTYYQELSGTSDTLTNSDFELALKKIQTQMMITELSNQIDSLNSDLTFAKSSLSYAQSQVTSAVDTATAPYEEKIANAQKLLDSLGNAYWNIYDRNDTPGYQSFGSTTDNLEILSNIFPIFFYIVAALVCLTTMTRMVNEDRTNVGTLKALGYDDKSIAAKYILYSLSACIFGCTIGIAVGIFLFPYAIISAYSIMYTIPQLEYHLPVGSTVIGIAISLASTVLATLLALRQELSESPASLMRAKAPKPGKRILLEHIRFIWVKISFTGKVTCRNLFRNKQRFFMTILGISGCTALLLASAGMYGSVDAIRSKQYGENAITRYDFQVLFEDAQDGSSGEYKTVVNTNSVESVMLASVKSVTGYSLRSEKDEDVYLFVPSEPEALFNYVDLHNRKTGKTYIPSIEGALVTEKFARDTNTKVGDTVFIQTSDGNNYEIFVSGIVENYTFHYIYLSPDYYLELFGTMPSYNLAIGNLSASLRAADSATLSAFKGQFASSLMQLDGVQAVSFTSDTDSTFSQITDALTGVIIVFFVSALILAFVVLYNLTNINIMERNREIATLKVLGFIDREVNSYILRENVILTLFGSVLGIGFGILLHWILVTYAEIDTVMFGRDIAWYSFIIAVLLTFAFTAIVNLFINRKLKKIDMVLSLKSVE